MVDRVDWENVNDCRRDATYCWAEENCWKCLLLVVLPAKLPWQSKSISMGIFIPRSHKIYYEPWKAFSIFLLEEKVIRNWMSKRGWNHRKLSNRKNHDLIEDALSKQLFVEESIRFSFEQLKVAFDWLQIFSNCHWWNIFDTWLDAMKITVWDLGVWERVHLDFSLSLSPSLGLVGARVGILLQVRCER